MTHGRAEGPTETEAASPRVIAEGRERTFIARRGRRLQYLTIAWNAAECVVGLAAGVLAGSIVVVGFGLDSAGEVTASLAALWRLSHDRDAEGREIAERRSG